MGRDCLSGPRCCTGIDCRDVLLRPNWPEWEQMTTAEGEEVLGSFAAAAVSGFPRPNHTAKWSMVAGHQLAPDSSILSSGSEAWFHSIELDGDVDLQWDGGTIQLRGSAGTVTAGGHPAPIMPDDAKMVRTVLTLYVTPTWYVVIVERYHKSNRRTFPGDEIVITTRGSVQVIDRENDPSAQNVTLTAIGDVSVYQWRVADASVLVEDDAVVDRCSRPGLPIDTEANFQFQNAGTNSFTNYTGTWTSPSTMSVVGETQIGVSIGYSCFDGTQTVNRTHSYAGPIASGITRGVFHLYWNDIVNGWWFESYGDGGVIGSTGYEGSLMTDGYTCCPSGNCAGAGDLLGHTAWIAGFSTQMLWVGPTADVPYPKPAIRHGVALQSDLGEFDRTTIDVTLGPTSTAPATIQVTHAYPLWDDGGFEITEATLQWSAV